MKTFWRRYREGSRLSRTAFWVVAVSALLGLVTIVVNNQLDSRALDRVSDALLPVLFVGLLVQSISLHHDRRRARRPR